MSDSPDLYPHPLRLHNNNREYYQLRPEGDSLRMSWDRRLLHGAGNSTLVVQLVGYREEGNRVRVTRQPPRLSNFLTKKAYERDLISQP